MRGCARAQVGACLGADRCVYMSPYDAPFVLKLGLAPRPDVRHWAAAALVTLKHAWRAALPVRLGTGAEHALTL